MGCCFSSAVLALALAAAPGDERRGLKLDVDKAVDDVMARVHAGDLLHFEERIEVRDRAQESLENLLAGVDLECGATSVGPPTFLELRPHGGATIPVHADFIAPGKLAYKGLRKGLGKLFGSQKPPRFYVYAVWRGQDVRYAVREGPVTESALAAAPDVAWDLVATYRDQGEAVAAQLRLQRGFSSPQRARADERLPPWVLSTCRPRGFGR